MSPGRLRVSNLVGAPVVVFGLPPTHVHRRGRANVTIARNLGVLARQRDGGPAPAEWPTTMTLSGTASQAFGRPQVYSMTHTVTSAELPRRVRPSGKCGLSATPTFEKNRDVQSRVPGHSACAAAVHIRVPEGAYRTCSLSARTHIAASRNSTSERLSRCSRRVERKTPWLS